MISASDNLSLQLILILPLIAAVMIRLVAKHPNIREGVSLIASFSLLLLIYNLDHNVTTDPAAVLVWITLLPGLSLSFTIEPLGLIFGLMASFLWFVTSIYSIGYMRQHHEANQSRFYQFFAIAMAAVMGIAFAANLFTLYIFYELLTLSTFPLVVHAGTEKAKRGGRIYLTILLATSIVFFLLAMINTWLISGTLDFTTGGIFTTQLAANPALATTISILLALFIFGIAKAAIFPFHQWLPAAMVAPTPASALLHAVAVVKGGVFTILKVCVYIFGTDTLQQLSSHQVLLYVGGFSVLFSALVAMRQDNLKKRLAYSTVSQLGYITIGALLANSSGIIGAAMHMVTHAFGKITLFFCAGAILVMTNKTNISELRGIGRQMPITMAAFFVASLSIIGLPPTAGMWSKWYLLHGTIEAQQWWLMSVLGLSSILNIFYLLPISVRAFFDPVGAAQLSKQPLNKPSLEAPLPILIAIVISASACVILFLFPQSLYQLAASIPVADK